MHRGACACSGAHAQRDRALPFPTVAARGVSHPPPQRRGGLPARFDTVQRHTGGCLRCHGQTASAQARCALTSSSATMDTSQYGTHVRLQRRHISAVTCVRFLLRRQRIIPRVGGCRLRGSSRHRQQQHCTTLFPEKPPLGQSTAGFNR